MSAKLQVPHVLTRAMGSAQAVYFDSGEHRLFAWLHRSPDIRQADLGVVICKPFGYEAICAHRGMRAFAEAIAAAGMPALRFDYLGTGDSAEIDPEADQIEAWTLDVLAAVEELKLRTGVRDVCLLGFRLGALLAARATSESESVSGLISIAPITAGRRYLRELRTTRMAGALGLGPDETVDKTASPGGMEVSGFSLSAATIASLGKLDSSTLPSPIALPTLVIGAATMPVSGGPAHSAEAQGRTALPGLVEMLMTPPQFALVPKEIISATVEWLLQLPAQAPACPVRSTGEPLGGLESSGLPDQLTLAATPTGPQVVRTERPVFFGTDALLFGIVTQPPADEVRRRAVILLNAGADYHIGASRLYVSMARRWAQHGYVVLRMDLAGLGDSGTRPGRTDDDVFPSEALDDIRAAIAFLRSGYGVRDVTLAGLCSGAYHSLRGAVAGLPVNRILMVNPQNYFWKPGESLNDLQLAEVVHNPGVYRKRLFSPAAWKKLFTGDVNLVRIVKIYLHRPLLAAESSLRNMARRLRLRLPSDLGTELEEVVARGVRVVFVFAKDEPGIELLKLQAGTSVKRLAERCRIRTINSGDHVFTRSGPRAVMEKVVSDELFSRPEWIDKSEPSLPDHRMTLYDYFDRIAIIHLPDRVDRFQSLSLELLDLGIDIGQSKVTIPHAPVPSEWSGWPSRGVYGNFLSHLGILKQALQDGLRTIWVLEDNAIFSRRMRREQQALVETLQQREWDLCFFGHSLKSELAEQPDGLVPANADFIWAHCYAVHVRVLPRLVAYLERAVALPAHHPEGSGLYIDAAFTLFRRLNPDVVALVYNPALSIQKGCFSSLNDLKWYDALAVTRPLVSLARRARDHWWKLRA